MRSLQGSPFLVVFLVLQAAAPGSGEVRPTAPPATCPPQGCEGSDGQPLSIPVPSDILDFPKLVPITETWIRKHHNSATEVPFERGAWLWGDYMNEVENVEDIDGCMERCKKDPVCGHWAWQAEVGRCDLHKHEGSHNPDVDNLSSIGILWITGK